MSQLEIDGTVRVVRTIDTRKKDIDKTSGHIVIMNEQGDRIDVKGPETIITGFNPEDEVVVKVGRANQTLAEALDDLKPKKKSKK